MHVNLMRDRAGPQRVTNVELFFDLVYVFAVTQLSHFLLTGPGGVRTALQAALLLIMVWQLWAYTTWVTNWLDPDRIAVRLLLLAFKAAIWRRVSWQRIGGIAALGLLGLAVPYVSAVVLAACAAAVVVAVATADQLLPSRPRLTAAEIPRETSPGA